MTVGDTLTVNVTIDAGAAMYGVMCSVNYDCSILEYVSGDGVGGSGTIKIVESPLGETKVTYTLAFLAIKDGSSTISLTDVYVAVQGVNGSEEKLLFESSSTVFIKSIYNGVCGVNSNWSLSSDGTLELIGNGETYNYGTAEEVPWYNYSADIKEIKIDGGITYIGHYSFNSLNNLMGIRVCGKETDFSPYYVLPKKNNNVIIYGLSSSVIQDYAIENEIEFIPTDVDIPDAPIISDVIGNTVVLKENVGCEYSSDGIIWQKSNVFNNVSYDEVQSFYQRFAVTNTTAASPKSKAVKCIIVSVPKVLVGKTTLKITAVEGYKYSINGIKYQTENLFTNLVPNWEYTVYQEPINTDGLLVFKEENSAVFCTNGDDIIENINSTHLVWLRKLLLKNKANNLAADINNDNAVDVRDLINLKKKAADF